MAPDNEEFIKFILCQDKINERFTPLGLISNKGHFSVLIKCHDNELKKDVAIKFFAPSQLHNEYRILSFHREAQLLEKLRGQKNIGSSRKSVGHFISP